MKILTPSYLQSICVFVLLLAYSCGSHPETPMLFKKLPSEQTGITFNNRMQETKEVNLISFAPIYNGAGVGVGDLNNDGLEDLVFAGNMVSSKIYLNQGSMQFLDITEKAGFTTDVWCNGVSLVDINSDGFLDIYLTVSGVDAEKRKNLLFINQGDLTFKEEAANYGLDDNGYSTHAAFFDYDLDGDLDMYLLTYGNNEGVDLKMVNDKKLDGTAFSNDKLFRNNGDNTFTDVTLEAGILVEGYGLGIAIHDFNQDFFPDLYISNDFLYDDIVYINNGDGTFSDQAKEYLSHTSQFGMGIDIQDINGDALPDVMQLDMMPKDNYRQKKILGPMQYDFFNLSIKKGYTPQYMRNSLQIMQKGSGFAEIGQMAGVHQTDWSWSPLFADYDANGTKDLIVTNGFRRNVTDFDFRNYVNEQLQIAEEENKDPDAVALAIVKQTNDIKLSNYAYSPINDYQFADSTKSWGLDHPSWSNGMIYADLDNDGDLDIVISNIDDQAFVYRNELNERSDVPKYLKVKLEGTTKNPEAIGARVVLTQSGKKQHYYQSRARGYLSNVSSIIHFGLGQDSSAVQVRVIWPDGNVSDSIISTTNTLLKLDHENSKPEFKPGEAQNPLKNFNEASIYGLDQFIPQNEYVDFNYEPLLPHKLSEEGGKMTHADINGDGRMDFFVGGAAGEPGYFFIQQTNDKFLKKALSQDAQYEDIGVHFFDADNDNDMDLYVVSGSNEFESGHELYQDRLYLNDGLGNFTKSNQLPEIRSSGSVVVSADIDGDGDLDLFVGGRLKPRAYPLPGRSYLLKNQKGQFIDVTAQWSDQLSDIGMVTDAIWEDMNGDGTPDLILTGEFMGIHVFYNQDGKLVQKASDTELNKATGWWKTLWVGDIDGNGRKDILAGNVGENTKYKVSPETPVQVYAKDYDLNGMIDPVMSYFHEGEEQIVHSKSTLESQINRYRKKFIKHDPFAQANFDEILEPELRKDAFTLRANTFSHHVFYQKENGFEVKPLPLSTQVAPITTFVKQEDNFYTSGNAYHTEVAIGQYDASRGTVLHFDRQKNELMVKPSASYIIVGEIKDAISLQIGKQQIIIHSRNNDTLYVSTLTKN